MIPDVDALKTRVDAVQTHREIPPWQVQMTLKTRVDAARSMPYAQLNGVSNPLIKVDAARVKNTLNL